HRQAEALEAYQDARRALGEELGIEPGERLRDLERAILAQDPALAAPAIVTEAPAPPAPPGRPERRLVTVLCAGLAPADTDPEVLDARLDRLGAVIERHGGSVENVAGDVAVGVFGLA